LLYTGVADVGHYERGVMGTTTDGNKCIEILKSTDAWELWKEDKARKLQRKRSGKEQAWSDERCRESKFS
jgi:hypothetical protein